MLPTIRRLVYKMGFRPNPGTILFSPSLALVLRRKDVLSVAEEFKKALSSASEQTRQLSIFDTEGLTVWPGGGAIKSELYDSMIFCVACGAKLEPFVIDIKECPDCHGRMFPEDDRSGLPVILFEPEVVDGR